MTDGELAVKKAEEAMCSQILSEIYRMRSENTADKDIVEALIRELTSKLK